MIGEVLERRLGHAIDPSVLASVTAQLVAELGSGSALRRHVAALAGLPLDAAPWRPLLRVVLNRTTRFFRHPGQLGDLCHHLASRPHARIWSVGCATGEEPYSLSLLLGPPGFRGELLATDVSEEWLEWARAGRYPGGAIRELPDKVRARFVPRPDGGSEVPPETRAAVSFVQLNLADPAPYPRPAAGWDVILCRNVLLYFTPAARLQVVCRFAEVLSCDGLLVLGPSEHVPPRSPLRLVPLGAAARTFAYAHADPSATDRRGAAPATIRPASPPRLHTGSPRARSAVEQAEALEVADPSAAAAALAAAAGSADLDADLHWRIGRAYRRLGLSADAVEALRRALLLQPDSWAISFQLAGAAFDLGDHQEALRAYSRTLRLVQRAVDEEPLCRAEVEASCRLRIRTCRA